MRESVCGRVGARAMSLLLGDGKVSGCISNSINCLMNNLVLELY